MLKFQSVIFFFIFLAHRQNIDNFIFPDGCFIDHNVWLKSDQNCRSSILKFSALYGPVLTKIAKCHIFF